MMIEIAGWCTTQILPCDLSRDTSRNLRSPWWSGYLWPAHQRIVLYALGTHMHRMVFLSKFTPLHLRSLSISSVEKEDRMHFETDQPYQHKKLAQAH